MTEQSPEPVADADLAGVEDDLEYDLAHQWRAEAGDEAPPVNDESAPPLPPSSGQKAAELIGDYGYDEAHDILR